MSVCSMTGHGRATVRKLGLVVTVELASVNRKQMDVRIHLPRNLSAGESDLADLVKSAIDRGCVTGSVSVQYADASKAMKIGIDRSLVGSLIEEIRSCADDLGIDGHMTMESLIHVPGVVVEHSATDDVDNVLPLCRQAVRAAVKGLVAMRKEEGNALHADLSSRLSLLEKMCDRLERRAPAVKTQLGQALKARLEAAGATVSELNDQIARELVVFAERSDVSEELTRLRSHFSQTRKLLASKKPVGRTLDFICQELFREINTTGSKANDAKMAAVVVNFKAELERFREQVQNVE